MHGEYEEKVRAVTCECGFVASGRSDDELVATFQQHLAAEHPDLGAGLERERVLAMAEEPRP